MVEFPNALSCKIHCKYFYSQVAFLDLVIKIENGNKLRLKLCQVQV